MQDHKTCCANTCRGGTLGVLAGRGRASPTPGKYAERATHGYLTIERETGPAGLPELEQAVGFLRRLAR